MLIQVCIPSISSFILIHIAGHVTRVKVLRWVIMFLIGVVTALVGVSMSIPITKLSNWKFGIISESMKRQEPIGSSIDVFVEHVE